MRKFPFKRYPTRLRGGPDWSGAGVDCFLTISQQQQQQQWRQRLLLMFLLHGGEGGTSYRQLPSSRRTEDDRIPLHVRPHRSAFSASILPATAVAAAVAAVAAAALAGAAASAAAWMCARRLCANVLAARTQGGLVLLLMGLGFVLFWGHLQVLADFHLLDKLAHFDRERIPERVVHAKGAGAHGYFEVTHDITKAGEVFLVKFHFKTNQGIRNLSGARAAELAGSDPDYATRDLFNAIDKGDYPSWTLFLQVMPAKEAESYRFNVLDVTKVWPHKDYPLIPVGQLVLNSNPTNYFQEVEQVAFSPGHLVPGIEASEDKMLQGRLFSYPDTHRHRLGANYDQIPVNVPRMCPLRALHIRDGAMCVNGNYGGAPNYEPNSCPGAPKECPSARPSALSLSGVVAHHPQRHPNDDFEQAGALYRDVLTPQEKEALVQNIAGHLKHARRDVRQSFPL
ncbi:hypothetical protein ACSSS7_006721 [Eimeria intestinalis]